MSTARDKLFNDMNQRQGNAVQRAASRAVREIGTELKRLGILGTSELGNVMFNGHAYHPTASGQNPVEPENGQAGVHGAANDNKVGLMDRLKSAERQPVQQHQMERGGMDR